MKNKSYTLVLPGGKESGPFESGKIRGAYRNGRIPEGTCVNMDGVQVPIADWLQPPVPEKQPETPAVEPQGAARKRRRINLQGALIAVLVVVSAVAVSASFTANSAVRELQASQDQVRGLKLELQNEIGNLYKKVNAVDLSITTQAMQLNEHNKEQRTFLEDGLELRIAELGTRIQNMISDARLVSDSTKDARDRILALERRFGLAPDPNPHPKEAFKARGLPGPDLEEKDKK